MFVITTFVRNANALRGDPPTDPGSFYMRHFDTLSLKQSDVDSARAERFCCASIATTNHHHHGDGLT